MKKEYDMKPIVDLIDNSINKLESLISKDHSMNCNTCGQIMDLRDLSQVFANGISIDYETMEQIEHSGSQRIGSSELHTKNNGIINLN